MTEEELKEGCDQALRDLCEAGLIWRYGPTGVTDEIRHASNASSRCSPTS